MPPSWHDCFPRDVKPTGATYMVCWLSCSSAQQAPGISASSFARPARVCHAGVETGATPPPHWHWKCTTSHAACLEGDTEMVTALQSALLLLEINILRLSPQRKMERNITCFFQCWPDGFAGREDGGQCHKPAGMGAGSCDCTNSSSMEGATLSPSMEPQGVDVFWNCGVEHLVRSLTLGSRDRVGVVQSWPALKEANEGLWA